MPLILITITAIVIVGMINYTYPALFIKWRFFKSNSDLQMFHENSNNNIDEDKLRHKNKDDEEDRGDDWAHTAVLNAVVWTVTVITQRILHHRTSEDNHGVNKTIN